MRILFYLILVILCFCGTIYSQSESALIVAIKKNNLSQIKQVHSTNAELINIPDKHGATPLMWATYKSDLPTVQYLVAAGADTLTNGVIYLDDNTNGFNYYGNLLSIAAGEGKLNLVKYYVEELKLNLDQKGYFPQYKANTGWTALDWAKWQQQEEVIAYLSNPYLGQEKKEFDLSSYDEATQQLLEFYAKQDDPMSKMMMQAFRGNIPKRRSSDQNIPISPMAFISQSAMIDYSDPQQAYKYTLNIKGLQERLSQQSRGWVRNSLDMFDFDMSASADLEEVEKKIAAKLADDPNAFSHITEKVKKDMNISWLDVRESLAKRTAAVEFIHSVDKGSNGDLIPEGDMTVTYYALVLRPEDTVPNTIVLGKAAEIEAMLKKINSGAQREVYQRGGIAIGNQGSNVSEEVYNFAWAKLEKYLADTDKVYFSPSGLLNLVAFNALKDKAGIMLSDKYELHQISTTKQLLAGIGNLKAPKDDCWTVVGDLNYDGYPYFFNQTKSEECSDINMSEVTTTTPLPPANTITPLAATKDEINTITTLLAKKSIPFQKIQGKNGCEEYLKFMGTRYLAPAVLHVATHGYHIPSGSEKPNNMMDMIQSVYSMYDQNAEEVKSAQTGLYLAGAGQKKVKQQGFPNREDGFWTESEIKDQNLLNTKLAVLSACETGIGDDMGFEGVNSLSRAFKMAGVQNTLVSLWKVSDEGTAFYMQKFYEHWLGGKTAYEAYRQTQKDLQQHPTYNAPYYWASFVLIE